VLLIPFFFFNSTESVAFLLSLIAKQYDIIIVKDLKIFEEPVFSFLKETFCKLMDLSMNYEKEPTLFLCFHTINEKQEVDNIFFHEPYRFGKPIILKQQNDNSSLLRQSKVGEKNGDLPVTEECEENFTVFTDYSVYHKVREDLIPLLFQPSTPFLIPSG
jgi:hypothetical protein